MGYDLKIKDTDDGSKTLYISDIDEHYHSYKGASTESMHIFINMGLKQVNKQEINVFEIGFGTGLNALLTLLEAKIDSKKIKYETIENNPLQWSLIDRLGYADSIDTSKYGVSNDEARCLFRKIHEAEWNEWISITPYFDIKKIRNSIVDFCKDSSCDNIREYIDVVYFDAFAPEKQPELWSEEIFNMLYIKNSYNGLLTTYCSKGMIRRLLQDVGYLVERLEGPPGGKREILRAKKVFL